MAIKSIFKLLIIFILMITILNSSYADPGPAIGENQAKKIAQDYLNSHNLPYTAIIPNSNVWYFYVKDTKTGKNEWISVDTFVQDDPDYGGPGKYKKVFDDIYEVCLVQVNNKNEKKVGTIYVDGETGKILKVTISQKSQTKKSQTRNQSTSTNTTNVTDTTIPVSPESSSNNTGIIFGIFLLISAIGAGYFTYTKI